MKSKLPLDDLQGMACFMALTCLLCGRTDCIAPGPSCDQRIQQHGTATVCPGGKMHDWAPRPKKRGANAVCAGCGELEHVWWAP